MITGATQGQVGELMAYAAKLSEASWKRWLLSLGVVTGGRLNEISQLTTSDIQTLESGNLPDILQGAIS